MDINKNMDKKFLCEDYSILARHKNSKDNRQPPKTPHFITECFSTVDMGMFPKQMLQSGVGSMQG